MGRLLNAVLGGPLCDRKFQGVYNDRVHRLLFSHRQLFDRYLDLRGHIDGHLFSGHVYSSLLHMCGV